MGQCNGESCVLVFFWSERHTFIFSLTSDSFDITPHDLISQTLDIPMITIDGQHVMDSVSWSHDCCITNDAIHGLQCRWSHHVIRIIAVNTMAIHIGHGDWTRVLHIWWWWQCTWYAAGGIRRHDCMFCMFIDPSAGSNLCVADNTIHDKWANRCIIMDHKMSIICVSDRYTMRSDAIHAHDDGTVGIAAWVMWSACDDHVILEIVYMGIGIASGRTPLIPLLMMHGDCAISWLYHCHKQIQYLHVVMVQSTLMIDSICIIIIIHGWCHNDWSPRMDCPIYTPHHHDRSPIWYLSMWWLICTLTIMANLILNRYRPGMYTFAIMISLVCTLSSWPIYNPSTIDPIASSIPLPLWSHSHYRDPIFTNMINLQHHLYLHRQDQSALLPSWWVPIYFAMVPWWCVQLCCYRGWYRLVLTMMVRMRPMVVVMWVGGDYRSKMRIDHDGEGTGLGSIMRVSTTNHGGENSVDCKPIIRVQIGIIMRMVNRIDHE